MSIWREPRTTQELRAATGAEHDDDLFGLPGDPAGKAARRAGRGGFGLPSSYDDLSPARRGRGDRYKDRRRGR